MIKKEFTPQIIVALLVYLVASCSKKPAVATMPVWSASSTIAINPIITIGTLRSGMTIQEVITELGQPARTNAAGLEFPGFGLSITPAHGEMTLFPPFAGLTKDGIGMGSSRADVLRAYGEPRVSKFTGPGMELLEYEALGIKFQLHDGAVDWIDVVSRP